MKHIVKFFFRGLFALLPIGLSLVVITKLASFFETLFDDLLFTNFPELQTIPGFSSLFAISVIVCFGVFLSFKATASAFYWLEYPFKEVPILRNVYSAVKDLIQFFDNDAQKAGKVVLVDFPQTGTKAVGLLTRDDLSSFEFGPEVVGSSAVYFPMSYQLGGYTLVVPNKTIKETNMKVDQAMKLALTGWMNK